MRKLPLIAAIALAGASTVNAAQPSGNLNGATVTISAPLNGNVQLSNGTIQYTGSGAPATLASGSVLNGVTITGGTDNIHLADGASGVVFDLCHIPGVQGNASASALVTYCAINSPVFTAIYFDPPGNNLAITDNTITCDGAKCHEALHLVNGYISGLNISHNELIGMSRHGIEVQCQAQNAICQANYLHGWHKNPGDSNNQTPTDSHIAISWACGPSNTPVGPSTTYSNNCLIDSNVVNFDGQTAQPITIGWSQIQGIEAMGNNLTVSNNWIRNAGYNAYTWTTGITSKNNDWIGYTGPQPWDGEPGGPSVAPTVIGDQSFAINAGPAMPAAGPIPMASAAPVVPATQPIALTPIAPPISLVDNNDGTITVTSPTPFTQLAIGPTTVNSAYPPVTLTLPAPSTSAVIGGVPLNWFVSVAANGITATVQSHGGAPAGATWLPALVLPAVAPSGGNDTAALQAAINGGGTVTFEAGTYHVSATLNIPSGVTIKGVTGGSNPTTLDWTGGPNYFAKLAGNDSINGVTFGGTNAGAIAIDGSNVSITYCTLNGLGNGTGQPANGNEGIESQVTPSNITIDHCSVLNTRGDTGIEGFFGNNIHITYNTVNNCWEGIHLFSGTGNTPATGWIISHNSITQASRHAIELQNATQGMVVSYNYVGDWNNSAPGAWSGAHFAISAASGFFNLPAGVPGIQITDNVLIGDGLGSTTAIEILGSNDTVSGNYAADFTGSSGTFLLSADNPNMVVSNNVVQATNVTNVDGIAPGYTYTRPNIDGTNQIYKPGQAGMPAAPSIDVATAPPTTAPATQPAPVYVGHSRDGVHWVTDVTVQP